MVWVRAVTFFVAARTQIAIMELPARRALQALVQSRGGSQWVGTLRILPSQAQGSVFTVRDF